MTDTELTRQLAALLGWEVVGPDVATEYDFSREQLYIDQRGRYYHRTDEGWAEWRPLTDMNDAWMIVTKLRDAWTAATEGVSGLDPDFPRPFDDTCFFDLLRRNADRRWPWAFLYVTPRAICLAALKTRKKP